MAGGLIDGARVAADLLVEVGERAREFRREYGREPCLAAVIVGDDPGSVTYVRMKRNRARAVGVATREVALPGAASTAELVNVIADLSGDATVDGILLQHPVPGQVNERAAF